MIRTPDDAELIPLFDRIISIQQAARITGLTEYQVKRTLRDHVVDRTRSTLGVPLRHVLGLEFLDRNLAGDPPTAA
jgi:hypothetical protein